jgi:protein-tyrosine phosphatase
MPGYYDLHCHILFGVDDGPESPDDAMTMLQLEYDCGVRTVYLTPHYRRNMFEAPPELRRKHFERLKQLCAERFPDLELRLGCELYANMDMLQQIREDGCLTMDSTEFVLLEFPMYAEKRYMIERCQSLLHSGYSPIIAHAERYRAIRRDPGLLQTLADMGVYIQMNAASIIGKEGLLWKWFCKKAMERGLLHFIGSDAHDTDQRRPDLEKCAQYLEKTMGAEYRDQIMILNPQEILEGSV